MANDLVKKELRERVRSFWDTREGTVGIAFAFSALGGGLYAAYKLMPYIETLLKSTVGAIAFGLIAWALVTVFIIDSTLRDRLWLGYQLLMKAVTYSIFKKDPAAAARALNQRIGKMLEDARDAVRAAGGRVEVIRTTLEEFKEKQSQLANEVMAMQRNNREQADINSHLRKLGDVNAAVERMSRLDETFETSFLNLQAAETALVRLEDETQFKIDLQVKEHAAATGIADAWRAFARAFSRTTSANELRDMLSEYMSEDTAKQMGEIRAYVDDSKKVIKALEIRDDASTERGLQVLAALNRNVEFAQAPRLQTNVPSKSAGGFDYSRLK